VDESANASTSPLVLGRYLLGAQLGRRDARTREVMTAAAGALAEIAALLCFSV